MADSGYFLALGAGVAAVAALAYFAFLSGKGEKNGGRASAGARGAEPISKKSEAIFLPRELSKGKRKTAPLTGTCSFCGSRASLPFKCKFCGNLFCSGHRLPESHNCPGLGRFRRGI